MGRRRLLPAFPHIHFMAAAPLDAWARLLLTPGVRMGWRYWPRVLVNAALSACVTVITLPERVLLAPILWWMGRRSGWSLRGASSVTTGTPRRARAEREVAQAASPGSLPSPHPSPRSAKPERGEGAGPPTIVILGYYRSGTTHLHNLLACDPANSAPRWVQMLSPQGFVLSWFVLKLFLWAVLPTKRPQDDMAFGPEWPGEDDFALSNWALASPLCGRVVVPHAWEHFRRFHDLQGLSERERRRWRRTQWATVWKLRLLARERRVVLKSPPHTARLDAIADVLGDPGDVRFVYLTRDREAVLASNERLMRAMTPHHLQDPPPEAVVRARLEEEFAATERAFEQGAPRIPDGCLVRVRYEALIADPTAELRRVYDALGLKWTEPYEHRLRIYLDSVATYRSETQKLSQLPSPTARPPDPHQVPPSGPRRGDAPHQLMTAAAIAIIVVWLGLALFTGHRWGSMGMVGGIVIGHAATAKQPGTRTRGLAAALFAVLIAAAGMLLATNVTDMRLFRAGAPHPLMHDAWWAEQWRVWWSRFTHESTLLWTTLGALAAYRLGSRRFGVVPGT